jgi:hypothetical protein
MRRLLFDTSEADYPDQVEGARHHSWWGVGVIAYVWGDVGHTDYCVVPIGVTVLLGVCNPPRSWTGTWAPLLSRCTIAHCVDSLLCYGSSNDLSLSLKIIPKSKMRICIYTLVFELSLLKDWRRRPEGEEWMRVNQDSSWELGLYTKLHPTRLSSSSTNTI